MARALTHQQATAVMMATKLRPLEPYRSARAKWRCLCLVCDEIGYPSYDNVRVRGTGCWTCRNRKIGDRLRGDAAEAWATMRALGLEPLEPYQNVDHAWSCRCMICGKDVAPTLWSVKSRGSGCGYCSGNRIDEADAVAVMEAAELKTLEPYPGKAILPWSCECLVCHKAVSPSYNAIQQGRGGCGYCAGNRVDTDDALTTMHDAGLQPHFAFPGAHMPWPSVCDLSGHEVAPSYSSVAQGKGCRLCGLERTAATRRINPDYAASVMREAGLEPLEPYPGSRTRWPCRCVSCENVVTPTHDSVQQGGGGCLFCASGGYDPMSPGAVYLLRHDIFDALKVGIRNLTSDRLDEHARHGWVPIGEWESDDGNEAPYVETGVLGWWQNELEAPYGCTADQMPQSGYTETAPIAVASIEATRSMIELLLQPDSRT